MECEFAGGALGGSANTKSSPPAQHREVADRFDRGNAFDRLFLFPLDATEMGSAILTFARMTALQATGRRMTGGCIDSA